jgi:hypothetical protein
VSGDEDPVAWLRQVITANLEHYRQVAGSADAGEKGARCEAELAILDEHAPADFTAYGERLCRRCRWDDDERGRDDDAHHWAVYPCRTVRLLLSGYKHRPGYPERFANTADSTS